MKVQTYFFILILPTVASYKYQVVGRGLWEASRVGWRPLHHFLGSASPTTSASGSGCGCSSPVRMEELAFWMMFWAAPGQERTREGEKEEGTEKKGEDIFYLRDWQRTF